MRTIRETVTALRTMLATVEPLAQATGFVRRRSKLSGVRFVQTLVFGWLADPDLPLAGLCQVAASLGVRISPQGLEQRFTPQAADLLRRVLEQALATLARVRATPTLGSLLDRFSAVFVSDCTVIGLPGALATTWPGCGNASTPAPSSAALKAAVRLELRGGTLHGPVLCPGRTHDRAAPEPGPPAAAGALDVADLGYFSLERFAGLSARGVFWLSRLQMGTVLWVRGQRHTAESFVPTLTADRYDGPIELGGRHRLPARLVAVRVPPPIARERRRRLHADARRRGQLVSRRRLLLADWTLLVTTVPPTLLSTAEVVTVYGARWQIELLFKLWKSCGGLARSRSAKPQRILCEVYAKLLAMVVQHGVLVATCWQHPDRSLVQAARTVRWLAVTFAGALASGARLTALLRALRDTLAAGCRLTTRRARPSTYQRLLVVQTTAFPAARAA
jgi:DDE family transposase